MRIKGKLTDLLGVVLALIIALPPTLLAQSLDADSPAVTDTSLGKIAKTRELILAEQSRKATGAGKLAESEFTPDKSSIAVRMIQGLMLCIGMLLVGAWAYKKFSKKSGVGGSSKRLRVIDRIPITAKSSVALVSVDGKEVLVALGSEHISIVSLENQVLPISTADLRGALEPLQIDKPPHGQSNGVISDEVMI